MSEHDRLRWEAKYREAAGAKHAPARASLAWIPPASAGALALDVACGRGRHFGPLLGRGYRVVGVDIAAGALQASAASGAPRGRVMLLQADLDSWPFARDVFDLVVQCDFLDRRLFGHLKASVRPGGHVLIDTFCGPASLEHGPSCRDYRLEPGELAHEFSTWEILRAGDCDDERDAIFARKPRF